MGHVAEEVLRTARCPVVLVGPQWASADFKLRQLLLPHDGSPETACALSPAVALAERAGAELLVLHVAGSPAAPPGEGLPVPLYVDQPQHEWPEWTREFLERMEVYCDLPAHLRPRVFLAQGEAGEEILRFAARRGVDLIATAWHGSLLDRHAATAKALIARARCPVLFTRTHPGAAGRPPE
jgi:nucleotide-binding universal stress UspA family protein